MRINTFRVWVASAVQQGVGAAKRAGVAISRRVRDARGRIEAGVGVGDDESSFGGGRGSRAWFEAGQAYVKKLRQWLFEHSTFERFPRIESFFRKFLGLHPKPKPPMLPSTPPPKAAPRAPAPPDAAQAARMRAQLQAGRLQATTQDRISLRQMERRSRNRLHSKAPEDALDDEDEDESDHT